MGPAGSAPPPVIAGSYGNFNILRKYQSVFQRDDCIIFLLAKNEGSNVSTFSPPFGTACNFYFRHPSGCEKCVIVVLTFISPKTNNGFEHLLMKVLTIFISSVEKYLFKLFVPLFKLGFFSFFCRIVNFHYIFRW